MKTRNTVQRQIVLDAVQRMHHHPTADDVFAEVSKAHPSISKATVYRNLYQLADQHLIRRVQMTHGADRFDYNVTPHYHLRCRVCGEVVDVTVPYLDDAMSQMVPNEQVIIEKCNISFDGVCVKCAQEEQENA